MNKQRHRLVFNPRRGQIMAVAESASCVGGAAKSSSIGLALSLVMVFSASTQAQIVADPNAPGHQRPTVHSAPNGVPLVNIQTPTPAGVSRNTYRQFDVQSNGAILNNSRTQVQTQLGGWVQGNPWLATGSARIIVNEVNLSGGNPGMWTLNDLWQVFNTNNSMHSCYGTGAAGCTQVEIPMPGGPQGTPEGNAKLIEYVGGKRKGTKETSSKIGGAE